MIRIIFVFLMYLVSLVTFSQSQFEESMQQAFQLMKENKIDEANNLFERIGNAEPTNWLPYYNVALLKTRTTFVMKDKAIIEAQLKEAEKFADKADVISPNNSEIYVVKALINVAKIASNPMAYGASLSSPTMKLYQQAIAFDNSNPRAHSGLADFEMGGARFFKQDLSPFCKKLRKSLVIYDAFQPKSPFHPKWGKERVLQVLKGCGDSTSTVKSETTITVTVVNVSSSDGVVKFGLHNKETFLKIALVEKEASIKDGKATVVFKNVAPGEYAIACFHDKNGNQRMDFSENGMPLEDYGATNNIMSMGPPVFSDAKFSVANEPLDFKIKF